MQTRSRPQAITCITMLHLMLQACDAPARPDPEAPDSTLTPSAPQGSGWQVPGRDTGGADLDRPGVVAPVGLGALHPAGDTGADSGTGADPGDGSMEDADGDGVYSDEDCDDGDPGA